MVAAVPVRPVGPGSAPVGPVAVTVQSVAAAEPDDTVFTRVREVTG